jgi:hypothetical protein
LDGLTSSGLNDKDVLFARLAPYVNQIRREMSAGGGNPNTTNIRLESLIAKLLR